MHHLLSAQIRHGGLSLMDIAARLGYVIHNRYDIVHAFEPRPATVWPALMARKIWGSPYVAECADLWGPDGIGAIRGPLSRATLGRFDHWMEKFVWGHADGVAALTTYMRNRVHGTGLPEDRIRVVFVGADFEHIVPLPQPQARLTHGVPLDADVVAHTGFTHYDARLLADMFVELVRVNPKAFLLMSGGRLAEVEARLAEAGLQHFTRHVGFVPREQMSSVLACCDVVALPYSRRPINLGRFPIRFGDCLAAGKPLVTNPTGDLGDIVQQEGVGLVAPEEPLAYAGVVQSLLANKPLQIQMGQRARALAETKFSWRVIAEQMHGLYQELLRRG
jgi:glycosyltransferase involved in cell wall biosynthesis